MGQPRFAHSGLAHYGDDLPSSLAGALQHPGQRAHLSLAANESRQTTQFSHFPTGACCRPSRELECLDGFSQPLHDHGAQRAQIHETLDELTRTCCQANASGSRRLLHPGRQMNRGTIGLVLHGQIIANGVYHHLAGIESHANIQPVVARSNGLLHVEGCIARSYCVILMGQRCAEQRHDSIALHPVDDTLVAVDRLHHGVDCRLQAIQRLLWIQPLDKRSGALDIGEQHRHLLTLALEGGPGVQDALGKMRGRIGLR